MKRNNNKATFILIGFLLLFVNCSLPITTIEVENADMIDIFEDGFQSEQFPFITNKELQGPYIPPTPNPAKIFPPITTTHQEYAIQLNDTLAIISEKFNTSARKIMDLNPAINPNLLYVDQVILIPAAIPTDMGPSFKLIPDSELVNGGINHLINLEDYINSFDGYFAGYFEEVNGELLSGWEIIELVAENYSVNPRLLIAIIEFQSGWLTQSKPSVTDISYPVGLHDPYRSGLYYQSSWAADRLNNGYYRWKANTLSFIISTDGLLIPLDPTINSGTAALQYLFGKLYTADMWRVVVSEDQFFQTMFNLYGNPFQWANEPQIPEDLTQPTFELPFEENVAWYFTGGPHGGWDDGSAWAALDFAPPAEILGCVLNDNWVVAMADGLIVKSENGGVYQDLDGDGNLGTGWVIFYMHIGNNDKVEAGTSLQTGDRIGHPSCEGGYSTGTHLHLARKYNGEWITADGKIPFIISDWTSHGNGIYYDGYLQNSSDSIYACDCQSDNNLISK
jgi:LasA protease